MGDTSFDIRSLPKGDDVFELGREIGSGVTAKVYEAKEKRSGRKLAIKIIKITPDNEEFVREECRLLTTIPKHENIVDLYDIYVTNTANGDEVWIAMELCTGTALDFVQKMENRLRDSHISYIIRQLIQAVKHLHENGVIHRDIRASNILVARDGEIRLADFGISKMVESPSAKTNERLGSPGWMAPEMLTGDGYYDNRVDVWAMGITAIELAEGEGPFEKMHPARAHFQIIRNPPPGLIQSSKRSAMLQDFINECLEKNPENRPVIHEFVEHPLFQANENVQSEIATVMNEENSELLKTKRPEILIRNQLMRVENHEEDETILNEDLAMLQDATEDTILKELRDRFLKKDFCTFLGDVLLVLNPNEDTKIYGQKYHEMYRLKARSDNAPHVYSIADSAYQDVFHHEDSQQILVTGETMSGKTTNMLHMLDHLLFLGQGNKCGDNVRKSINIIHALGNAGTETNPNSTRHILQTQVSFTATGKTSGAIFWIYQLERNTVSSTDGNRRNFHIFYMFFNALQSENKLEKYFLETDKNYKFLRSGKQPSEKGKEEYAKEFAGFEDNLKDIGFDDGQLKTIRRVLAAILILGEIEFETDDDGNAKLATQKESDSVADLLGLDPKKFSWALLKYCVITKGEAVMRHHTKEEALEAKNVLARGLYFRLVDWIVNSINEKLSIPRALFGDKYTVNLLDLFGFECHSTNTIDQLIINCMNEQIKFFYNQKVFAWDMKNAEQEEITMPDLNYNDNKVVMDELLQKPEGLIHLIDEATKSGGIESFAENLQNLKKSHISLVNENDFSIAHYTGKITYKTSEILNRNREFLPPEMIETMRRSSVDEVRKLFTGLLTTTGNLTMHTESDKIENREGRWNTGFRPTNKKFKGRKFNTSSKGQYSQSRQMRTSATTFRATCLEILKSLTSSENNTHFVNCVRSNLSNSPNTFHNDLVRQQLRAWGTVETVHARQKGYSYRLTFSDFIKRYRFLAFDFNETVEETKENCRLLLIRLKMEGWTMGKTQIFLKYCDKEYLSRLYGINVRKIVKVQSMMRAFLTRRNLNAKIRRFQENLEPQTESPHDIISNDEEKCDGTKGHEGKGESDDTGAHPEDIERKTIDFIKPWVDRWKKQSVFQILLFCRSKQQMDLVYFCQQVHLYNQNNRSILESIKEEADLQQLDYDADPKAIFPTAKISIHKTNFRLRDITFFDTSHLLPPQCDDRSQNTVNTADESGDEEWDAPLKHFLLKYEKQEKREIEETEETKETEETQETQKTISANDKCDKECQTEIQEVKEVEDRTTDLESRGKDEGNNCLTNEAKSINGNSRESQEPSEIRNEETKPDEVIQKRKPPNYIGVEIRRNSILEDMNNKANHEINKENRHKTSKFNTTDNNFSLSTRNVKRGLDPTEELPKYKTPITEMEEKFRTESRKSIDEDDPPYNFRSMLRKTNYSDPLYQRQTERTSNTFDFTLRKTGKNEVVPTKKTQNVCVCNLTPNLVIEGEVTDL